jgi:hypothetical protein
MIFPIVIILVMYISKLSTAVTMNSCSSPLGMESGTILDSQLTASSSFASSVGPAMGRLRSVDGGGAWCPATMVSNYSKEWLEVDLEKKMMITGISLQGRWDNGVGQEFAPFVSMMYYDDVTGQFAPYSDLHGDQVMAGNTDTYSVAEVKMDPPVVTDRIRVIPYSQYQRSVCVRAEIRGCPGPHLQDTAVDQKLVVEHGGKWSFIPLVIGILLTTSILLVVVIICMYMRMNKRKQELTGSPIYQIPQLPAKLASKSTRTNISRTNT